MRGRAKANVLAATVLAIGWAPWVTLSSLLHVFGGAVLLIGSLAVLAALYEFVETCTLISRARRLR